MLEGQASRTALGAAGHRAAHQVLEKGFIFRDPLALRILGDDAQAAIDEAEQEPRRRGLRLFIAVRTREAKARLSPIAWNQPAITEAAVTFIVCGQLADSSVIPERLAPLVEAGVMPAAMVPEWEIPARDLYMEYPQRQRDEAVRTGTFGAAAMIYAARSLGLGSTPMIGFDAEAVHREFGLAKDDAPVMLLSVGSERPGNWSQKPRRPVADVLDLV